jgi:hypothetical protein
MDFMAPGALILAPYETAQFHGKTIFRDFLHMLGIKKADEFDFKVPRKETNRGMAAPLVEQLRLFNRLPLSKASHVALVAEMSKIEINNKALCLQATKSLLTTSERRLLRGRTEANLEKLRRYFRPGFDDSFLRSDTVSELLPDQIPVRDPERDLSLLVLFQLLQKQQAQVTELSKRLDELAKCNPRTLPEVSERQLKGGVRVYSDNGDGVAD